VNQTYLTSVLGTIELLSLYSVQLSIPQPLTSGQLVAYLVNFCLARYVASSITQVIFWIHVCTITNDEFVFLSAALSWREWSWPTCGNYKGNIYVLNNISHNIYLATSLNISKFIFPFCLVLFFISLILKNCGVYLQVLGTPTREEIKCMNPNYTEFKFPQIKAHPWHKVCNMLACLFY
jgi:hypothetical protein